MGEAFDQWETRMLAHKVPSSGGHAPQGRGAYGGINFAAVLQQEREHYDHLSASQLKTWYRCRRLWFLTKVAAVKEPQRYHLDVGHALHHIAERYQLRLAPTWAELFDTGWDKKLKPDTAQWVRTMAAAAVEKGFWQATPSVKVEFPVAMLVGDRWRDERGMPWLARTETKLNEAGTRIILRPAQLIDGSPLPQGWDDLPVFVGFADQVYLQASPPMVRDHKTAKNRTYATTAQKLGKDVQVLNYGAGVLAIRRDAEAVDFAHNVFLKNDSTAAGAYEVKASASLASIKTEWDRTIQAAADMQLVRELIPVSQESIKAKDRHRADRWQEVKSAIEDGCAAESCNAYGGCPFRDVCNRRATAAEVVHQLDNHATRGPQTIAAPVPATQVSFGLRARVAADPLASPLPSTSSSPFGLRPSPRSTPTTHQESSMPFAPKPKLVPQNLLDGYLTDPENLKLQYRVRRLPAEPVSSPGLVMVYLWPHLDVEPMWGLLPPIYRAEVEQAVISPAPVLGAELKGYHQALSDVGEFTAEQCAWSDGMGGLHTEVLTALNRPVQPAAPAVPPSAGSSMAPATAVPAKPDRDGAFGLRKGVAPSPAPAGVAQGKLQPGVGAALSAQTARATAAPMLPPQTFEPKVGQIVQVAAVEPTTDYFKAYASAQCQGVVEDVVAGETQPMLDVRMSDGTTIKQAVVGRFRLIAEPKAQADPVPGGDATVQFDSFMKRMEGLVGKNVEIHLTNQAAPIRCTLDSIDREKGFVAMGGKVKGTWNLLTSIAEVPAGALAPGEKPKKPRKGKKDAAMEGAPAEGAPAEAVAPPEPAQVPGQTDLGAAIVELAERKLAVERMDPDVRTLVLNHLEAARQHLQALEELLGFAS